MFVGNYRTY